jgi:hypothetical protein
VGGGKPPLTPAMAARLGRTPGSVAAVVSGGAWYGYRGPAGWPHGSAFPPTPSVRQTILERVTFQVRLPHTRSWPPKQ